MVTAKLPGEKSFGAELPISLAERFAEQCDAMDCKKKTAIRAAIKYVAVSISPVFLALYQSRFLVFFKPLFGHFTVFFRNVHPYPLPI